MIDSEKTPDQIAAGLLEYLQVELDDSSISFGSSLTRIQGGFETLIYKFKLRGAPAVFAKPLILRLFPAYYAVDKAVWESAIQNAMADQGFPVPRVFFTCTDMTLLGGAFCIMEFIEGDSMATMPAEAMPAKLGEVHATLHAFDPAPIVERLQARGINELRYKIDGKFVWYSDQAEKNYPWLRDGVCWLLENRPPAPAVLSICHGDFHPLNILMKDGLVAGVLDWGNFLIADPVMDVAFTVELSAIHGRQLLPPPALDAMIKKYLDAYTEKRRLSFEHLAYYRAMRCVAALLDGARGQEVWRAPAVVKALIDYIDQTTHIRIKPPGY